jgi:hypothetical protein
MIAFGSCGVVGDAQLCWSHSAHRVKVLRRTDLSTGRPVRRFSWVRLGSDWVPFLGSFRLRFNVLNDLLGSIAKNYFLPPPIPG